MGNDFYTTDSPEQRAKCLSCDSPYCSDCLSDKGKVLKFVDDELKEKYMSLYEQGIGDRKAALQMGISTSSISRLRRTLGLEANRYRMPKVRKQQRPQQVRYITIEEAAPAYDAERRQRKLNHD